MEVIGENLRDFIHLTLIYGSGVDPCARLEAMDTKKKN